MPEVGFKPTIPVFEGVKKVHALDREATVISESTVYKKVNVYVTSFLRFLLTVKPAAQYSVYEK
jgi:hypothetical protein